MAISDNAQIEYEAGQNLNAFEQMTDSGDHLTFSASFSPWSTKSGFEAKVRPYGLESGGKIIPAVSGTNNLVDTTALSAYMPGESGASPDADGKVSVAADTDVACARPITDTHLVHSITVDTSGAIAVVSGAEGTSFSETRGAAGGPPLIPVTSVEIGQVRLSSQTAAPITADEIKQVLGTSQERWDFPQNATSEVDGTITFYQALPLIHTGPTTKKVYVEGYTPSYAPIARSFAWVPASNTYSISSTQTYDGPVGASSSSLAQASWTSMLQDGTTDGILDLEGERIWIRFKQDRNKISYQLTNGILGIGQTFPADGQTQASFTLSPEVKTARFAS